MSRASAFSYCVFILLQLTGGSGRGLTRITSQPTALLVSFFTLWSASTCIWLNAGEAHCPPPLPSTNCQRLFSFGGICLISNRLSVYIPYYPRKEQSNNVHLVQGFAFFVSRTLRTSKVALLLLHRLGSPAPTTHYLIPPVDSSRREVLRKIPHLLPNESTRNICLHKTIRATIVFY